MTISTFSVLENTIPIDSLYKKEAFSSQHGTNNSLFLWRRRRGGRQERVCFRRFQRGLVGWLVCACVCAFSCVWGAKWSRGCGGGLCGVALGPLFGYPVVLGSVGQVLGGDASDQRVRCNDRSQVSALGVGGSAANTPETSVHLKDRGPATETRFLLPAHSPGSSARMFRQDFQL